MTPENSQRPKPPPLYPFTVEGIVSLVSHLRTRSRFADQQEVRLRAMAIALLASEGARDNNHTVPPGARHPAYFQVHNAMPANPTGQTTSATSLFRRLWTWYVTSSYILRSSQLLTVSIGDVARPTLRRTYIYGSLFGNSTLPCSTGARRGETGRILPRRPPS